MTTATQDAPARRRLPHPLRALLHRWLLRGLRAPRLPHEPGWTAKLSGGQGLEALQVRGDRGQRLAAWLALPQAASAGRLAAVVVAVHGWGANGATLAPLVEPLVRAGIAVVLFDVASHGDSTAEEFSSLPRFAEDLAAVLDHLRELPTLDTARVGLLGHSVGAAAVLLHTARQGGVRAVVSLSAFAHPREVMERWLQEHYIPRRWIGTAILEHVQAVIGERFDRIAPAHQLSRIDCPVLLVHGEHDRTVPLADAHRLQALLRVGELLVVDGDHDLRQALVPHAERLVRFFATHLEPSDCSDGTARSAAWSGGTAAPSPHSPTIPPITSMTPTPHGMHAEDLPLAAHASPPHGSTGAPGVMVIDVRSEREFQATAIDQAVNLPLPQLAHRIGELVADRATPLVLYCASGARSGMACAVLKQLGYSNVTNAGGLYAAAAQLQRELRR